MTVYKEFTFDSAHWLPNVPVGHKCGRVHGHTYRLIVSVSGEPDCSGMIIDYADIAVAVLPILETIDHHLLNEIDGLDNPTTEVLARWLWNEIRIKIRRPIAVEVKESASTGCLYGGPF